jgi:hypothetical protein
MNDEALVAIWKYRHTVRVSAVLAESVAPTAEYLLPG